GDSEEDSDDAGPQFLQMLEERHAQHAIVFFVFLVAGAGARRARGLTSPTEEIPEPFQSGIGLGRGLRRTASTGSTGSLRVERLTHLLCKVFGRRRSVVVRFGSRLEGAVVGLQRVRRFGRRSQ